MNEKRLRLGVRAVSACALGAAMLSFGARVSADGPKPYGTAPTMLDAQAEFEEIDKSLSGASGSDCVTMCKALQSLARAAERICALAKDGTDADKKRCTDAKARLEEATNRVRAVCPSCSPTPPPTSPPIDSAVAGKAKGESEPAPPPRPMEAADDAGGGGGGGGFGSAAEHRSLRRRHLSLTLAPLRLLLPTYLVKLGLELPALERLSIALGGGFGSYVGTSGDRVSVSTIGGQLRGFFAGGFSGGGIFLGVDTTYAHASGPLSTRALTPGLTVGPIVGVKLVAGPGFTLDTHLGAGFVVKDDRAEGAPADKLVPLWDVRLGWTF